MAGNAAEAGAVETAAEGLNAARRIGWKRVGPSHAREVLPRLKFPA